MQKFVRLSSTELLIGNLSYSLKNEILEKFIKTRVCSETEISYLDEIGTNKEFLKQHNLMDFTKEFPLHIVISYTKDGCYLEQSEKFFTNSFEEIQKFVEDNLHVDIETTIHLQFRNRKIENIVKIRSLDRKMMVEAKINYPEILLKSMLESLAYDRINSYFDFIKDSIPTVISTPSPMLSKSIEKLLNNEFSTPSKSFTIK